MSTCAAQLSADQASQAAKPKFLTASIKLQINAERSEKSSLITILENKTDKVAGKNNAECEITSHVGQTLNLSMLGSLLKVEDESGKSLYYFSTIRKANSFFGTWARATQPGEGKGWIYLIMNSDSSLTLTKNCDIS